MPTPEHILQFFAYEHLPAKLQTISKPFCELAHAMVNGDNGPESGTCTFGPALPRNPERTVALRKLLEAKDAAVRALVAHDYWDDPSVTFQVPDPDPAVQA